MSHLIYLTRNYKGIGHGGGKARVDVEDILASAGARNIGLKRSFHRNKIIDFLLTLCGVLKFIVVSRRGDILFLQYPVKKYYRLICRVARLKGVRTITLIHDLGSFRRRKLTIPQEIEKLSLTDVIIAANDRMIGWLRDHGCLVPMTDQKVWDYLSDSKPAAEAQTPPLSCLYAGELNPAHNGYLYKLPPTLTIHLYGKGTPANMPPNIINHGFTPSDDIIAHGEGRFGLLWYGTDLVHNENDFIGEYIRYCNPHKLALYMRARKPVIIWEHAADAEFVKENGIGITVETLEDLDKTIASVTDEDYREMLANVDRLSEKMAHGAYLLSALDRALPLLPA